MTHLRQQPHNGLARLRADVQPVLYTLYRPLYRLRACVWVCRGPEDTERFDGPCVAPLAQIDGNEVKDTVMANAMHGETQSDGHGVSGAARAECELFRPTRSPPGHALARKPLFQIANM